MSASELRRRPGLFSESTSSSSLPTKPSKPTHSNHSAMALFSKKPKNLFPILVLIVYTLTILKSIFYPTQEQIEKEIKDSLASNQGTDKELEDDSENIKSSHPILGCMCTLVGAIFVGLSFVLQKKGNMSESEKANLSKKLDRSQQQNDSNHLPSYQRFENDDEVATSSENKAPPYCQLIWWQGILSLVIGEILQIAAYKFAPTTLVAPLGAFRVIVSTTLSKRMLAESINDSTVVGIITSILGATLIILHAPREEQNLGVTETISNTSTMFNVYFLLLIVSSVFGAYKVEQLKKLKVLNENARNPPTHQEVLVRIKKQLSLISILQTCTLGVISVCCTKLMTMLKFTLSDLNFNTAAILFLLVASAPIQIYYVNVALAVDKASKITPLKFAGTNVLIVIGSVLLFNEWDVLSGTDIIGMICGLLVVISGIRLVVMD